MKSIRQLIRQPVKTLAGIILVALAVAILVTCVGQYAAASLTRANLDDNYDTVALLSDKYFWENRPEGRVHYSVLPEEYRNWLDDTIMNRSDLIRQESYSEVYSAYVPGVSPDNFSKYENGDWMDFYKPDSGCGNPYRCAVLEVTLTKIGKVIDEDVVGYSTTADDYQEYRNYINILCAGTVERAIGLEQGFESPEGKTIALMIRVYDEAELEAFELEVGQRYLVYGMDYSDVKGDTLESRISTYTKLYEELFGPGIYDPPYPTDWSRIIDQIGCIMTACDYSSLPIIYYDNGKFEFREDLREYSYRDEDGTHKTYISAEEFIPNYTVPTIIKLDGTAEEFIESENGARWRQVLEEMEISNHGFPVLAVDKLGYQVTFTRQRARIVEGRDFTEEERTNGSKVCVISQEVASENGLSVGDTIELQTYAYDPNIEVQYSDLLAGTRFPSAAVYSRTLGFTSEMESYTIVGIYRQIDAWQNREDAYGITPNVIFVPKGSITGEPLTGGSGIYYTLVLQNGKMEEFQELQEEAGYPNLLVCYDQGYSEIVAALESYETVSSRALYVGIGAYLVILALFVILFPLRQRNTLATMESLGAKRRARIGHVMASSLGILLPGTAVGFLTGMLLWEDVTAELMQAVNVSVTLVSDGKAALLTAITQLAAAALITLLAALPLTKSALMKRK